jgi:kinesin family member 2/24
LVQTILTDEEVLITSHREHVDHMVDLVKQDMGLLQQVDNPNSDIETYVMRLDKSLLNKINKINEVRQQLVGFYQNLKKEEALQILYQK